MANSQTVTAPASSRPAPSDEVVVRAAGLTKVFKDFWGRPKARAVDNVDFEIRRGEIFGLLGPNGSGKSTTIKMMLGLLYPTKGAITVFNQSPRDVRTKARIGYLPEESYLYRYLNPGETLDFFGSLFQLDAAERRQRTEQLIEMVGLNQARSRTVGEFSKGMQRRIGIAQALINDPDLIILDEPTAGLDPQSRIALWEIVTELKNDGETILLTTHYMEEADQLCDRVAIMDHGEILALDTPERLKRSTGAASIVTVTAEGTDPDALGRHLQAALADVVTDYRIVDGNVLLSTTAHGLLRRILTAGEEFGATVTDLAAAEPTLENVFINLTGKDLRE